MIFCPKDFVFLRSEKLKSFWLSISEEEMSAMNDVSDAFTASGDCHHSYTQSVFRALSIPECKVVPYFGTFLQDLQNISSSVPSIIEYTSDGGGSALTVQLL